VLGQPVHRSLADIRSANRPICHVRSLPRHGASGTGLASVRRETRQAPLHE
jgi:hypothetical protein